MDDQITLTDSILMSTTARQSPDEAKASHLPRRRIDRVAEELLCRRRYVEFHELDKPDDWNGTIRVYGGNACAVLQLRGTKVTASTGKVRPFIATASYLDRDEVIALIEKLQEILPTLPNPNA